ncbi:translin isoform X3 [Ovis aries]|uniref:translin isoform X3 n=1 Tax=Ovis aries TaxID=9940 RepID=UPI0005FB8F3D|nr:translin isoform X3 [Ovis aries]
MSVSEIFVELQGFLAAEQDIREEIRKVVQSLEQTAREILTLLQGVHQGAGFQDIPKRCLKAREHFGTVKTHLTSLKTKFPAEQYYRFHEHWRFVLQRLVFLAAFVVYLESETLVTREAVTEILGIEVVCQQRDRRRLLPAPAHLHLHQRAGFRLPPPQPQKRFPEEALRWPEVRREESGGGSLRPLHPGFQQGDGSSLRGEVGGSPDKPC